MRSFPYTNSYPVDIIGYQVVEVSSSRYQLSMKHTAYQYNSIICIFTFMYVLHIKLIYYYLIPTHVRDILKEGKQGQTLEKLFFRHRKNVL